VVVLEHEHLLKHVNHTRFYLGLLFSLRFKFFWSVRKFTYQPVVNTEDVSFLDLVVDFCDGFFIFASSKRSYEDLLFSDKLLGRCPGYS